MGIRLGNNGIHNEDLGTASLEMMANGERERYPRKAERFRLLNYFLKSFSMGN